MKKNRLCPIIRIGKREKKGLKVKVLLAIIFANILSIHANSVFSQKAQVSLSVKHATVVEALEQLRENSGLKLLYSADELNTEKLLTANFTNAPLGNVLDHLLKNQKVGYVVHGDKVIITRKRYKAESSGVQQEKTVHLKGQVKDEFGEPIPGATVAVKGTTRGTSTDFDGKFELEVQTGQTIVVSFIGMKTIEFEYKGEKQLNITLYDDTEEIEEVIVTGYQTIDRKLFTGSASLVKAEDVVVEGVSDVGRMLQGKAAGVQVQNVSGTFGAAPKIRVRGASSIYGNSNPLWVVDGVVLEDVVEISADALASGNAVTLIGSAVAGINAEDIESFQILKDASATALYGARAMNGVIVITTKRGSKGDVRVNYNLEMTMKAKPNYASYDILNSQEQMGIYLDMRDKGLLNYANMARAASGGVFNEMYDLVSTYNTETQSFGLENTAEAKNAFLRQAELRNTDWFDVLFRNSIQQNHSLSLAGGNDKSNFYASVGFLNDPGWTVADKVSRFTANLNATVKLNDYISLNLMTNNSLRRQTAPGTVDRQMDNVSGEYNRNFDINPFSYALNASRTMAAYNDDGSHAFYNMNYAPFNILNESKYNFIDLDYLDSKIQAEISADLLPGLNLRVLGALRYVKTTREHKIDERSNYANSYRAAEDATIRANNKMLYKDPDDPTALPEVVLPEGGFYNRNDNTLLNYYVRGVANFNRLFNEKHNINALFGQEMKYADRSSSSMQGYGYQWGKGGVPFVDYRILRQLLDGGFQYYGMNRKYDRFVAFFATAGYSFDERYTLNLTGRYDGSNRLGKSKRARWLPTWNVSGAWHIKNEAFMEDVDLISRLNLRATYGLTASMGPTSNSMAVFENEIAYRPYSAEKENQIVIQSLENSELTWEKQYETNIGFDLGLFFNRISFSSDVYFRKGFDLIGLVSTSAIGGHAYKYANYADMKSSGIEFTLNTKNMRKKDFSWTSNLTFSYNKNEITALKSTPRLIALVKEEGGPKEGYPVRSLFSIPFAGLNEQGLPLVVDNYGEVTQTGVEFQSSTTDFLKYEGPIDPKIVGGFENSFTYKRFRLSAYITYQAGNKIRLHPGSKSTYSDIHSMSHDMLNRWIVPGDEDVTNVPTIPSLRQLKENPYLKEAYNSYNYSDVRVADGGFVRLKDVIVSYDIPGNRNMQVKLAASNVWLIYSDKKLNGQDPEFFRAGGVAMPMPRQYTLSFKIGF